ncbi:hypothetical protein BAE44_0022348, partial [Dichanthelium oligosanthes]
LPCTLPPQLQRQPPSQLPASPPASQATGRELKEAHAQSERPAREKGSGESSDGVRVPLQRLRRQQGQEAAAQEGAAQGAHRQDPAGEPRGAGRRRRRQQGEQLREMSKLLLADPTL